MSEQKLGSLLGGFRLTGRVGSFGGWVLFEAQNASDPEISRLIWVGDGSEAFGAHSRSLGQLHPAVAKSWGLRQDGGVFFVEVELFEAERLDRLRASWAGAAVTKTGATPFVPAQVMVEALSGGPARVDRTRVIVHDFVKKTQELAPQEPTTLSLKQGVERAQVIDLKQLRATAELEVKASKAAKNRRWVGVGVGGVLVLVVLVLGLAWGIL